MKNSATAIEWPSMPLSELCCQDAPIIYGILQPGPEVENGVPYVRPTEIDNGEIKLDEIRKTSATIADRFKRSMLKSGDLLITIVGL